MPVGIAFIDGIVGGVGVSVGADGGGEDAGGVALRRGIGIDGVPVVGRDEAGKHGIVPAGIQVDEAGVVVMALAVVTVASRLSPS
jgi:hypothetical protein